MQSILWARWKLSEGSSKIFSFPDTKIEDNSRAFKLQKANFDSEVNTAKAEAQLAYELQAAKIQQRIKQEELQIQVEYFMNRLIIFLQIKSFSILNDIWENFQVVERRKQIEIEEQEIKRKEKELMATVRLPAEAEAYKVQTVAEGMR